MMTYLWPGHSLDCGLPVDLSATAEAADSGT